MGFLGLSPDPLSTTVIEYNPVYTDTRLHLGSIHIKDVVCLSHVPS